MRFVAVCDNKILENNIHAVSLFVSVTSACKLMTHDPRDQAFCY